MPRACPVNLLFLIKESLKKINISLQILFFFLERERERVTHFSYKLQLRDDNGVLLYINYKIKKKKSIRDIGCC